MAADHPTAPVSGEVTPEHIGSCIAQPCWCHNYGIRQTMAVHPSPADPTREEAPEREACVDPDCVDGRLRVTNLHCPVCAAPSASPGEAGEVPLDAFQALEAGKPYWEAVAQRNEELIGEMLALVDQLNGYAREARVFRGLSDRYRRHASNLRARLSSQSQEIARLREAVEKVRQYAAHGWACGTRRGPDALGVVLPCNCGWDQIRATLPTAGEPT